jgi:Dyp-type peroxidase family
MIPPLSLDTTGVSSDDPGLKDVQCDVLKSHGREHSRHLFLKLPAGTRRARQCLRDFAEAKFITTMEQQLQPETKKGIMVSLMLSGGAIKRLSLGKVGFEQNEVGVNTVTPLEKNDFMRGMKVVEPDLYIATPRRSLTRWWKKPFGSRAPRIDVHVLIAGDKLPAVSARGRALQKWFERRGGTLLAVETGYRRRRHGQTIEHFGFVDGVSIPQFLNEDIVRARAKAGAAVFDPAFPPRNLFFPMNAREVGGTPRFGSFFVFRKMEQNVAAFLQEKNVEQLVGRRRDGTALLLPATTPATRGCPISNDFDYKADPTGGVCPFHSHVRKANPREIISPNQGGPSGDSREVLFPRRGMLYGKRQFDPKKDGGSFVGKPPKRGVGLLFMAYMRDIEDQFKIMQREWMNNPKFPPSAPQSPLPGVDQLTSLQPRSSGIAKHVTVLGGEYFFVPPVSWLSEVQR